MARRLKQQTGQLDLFGSLPEPAHEKSISHEGEVQADRPLPLTARDASYVRLREHARYCGFRAQGGRVVCRSCLDAQGAVRALAGQKFERYLWEPQPDSEGRSDFKLFTCAECGETFSAELPQ